MIENEIYHTLRQSDSFYAESKFAEAKSMLLDNLQPHPVFYFKLGQCELALENLDEAWKWFDKAEEESNHFFDPLEGKACVKLWKSEYADAISYFKAAQSKLKENYTNDIPQEELEATLLRLDAEISFCNLQLGKDTVQFFPGKQNLLASDPEVTLSNCIENHMRIMVQMTEGIGEQIAISTIFNEVINDFESVIVRCQPKLIPLFEKTFRDIQFVSSEDRIDHLDHEVIIEMNTLANLYRKSRRDFDRPSFPMFHVDQKKVYEFRKMFYDGRPIIGIIWNSPNSAVKFSKKNIPLENFECILRDNRYKFVSLQYGEPNNDIEKLGYDIEPRADIDVYDDVENLFCLIGSCDAVIGSSNTAHIISGSMGIPSFNLSHSGLGKMWIWRIAQHGRSLLFPHVRIIETKDGSSNWSVPISKLQEELAELFKRD